MQCKTLVMEASLSEWLLHDPDKSVFTSKLNLPFKIFGLFASVWLMICIHKKYTYLNAINVWLNVTKI